jgi:hypothetical protein
LYGAGREPGYPAASRSAPPRSSEPRDAFLERFRENDGPAERNERLSEPRRDRYSGDRDRTSADSYAYDEPEVRPQPRERPVEPVSRGGRRPADDPWQDDPWTDD